MEKKHTKTTTLYWEKSNLEIFLFAGEKFGHLKEQIPIKDFADLLNERYANIGNEGIADFLQQFIGLIGPDADVTEMVAKMEQASVQNPIDVILETMDMQPNGYHWLNDNHTAMVRIFNNHAGETRVEAVFQLPEKEVIDERIVHPLTIEAEDDLAFLHFIETEDGKRIFIPLKFVKNLPNMA